MEMKGSKPTFNDYFKNTILRFRLTDDEFQYREQQKHFKNTILRFRLNVEATIA